MNSVEFINCEDTLKNILNNFVNKTPFFYLRFGDGDFNLAENKHDLLSRPNIKLQDLMLKSMSLRDDRVMICLPHHCKDLNTIEKGMYPGNHEYEYYHIVRFLNILTINKNSLPKYIYTNVALSYCATYYPDIVINLHKEFKKNNILYIGNYLYDDAFLKKLFGDNLLRINTNSNNAFDQYKLVFNEFNSIIEEKYKNEFFIIIIAAGCASRAFAYEMYSTYFIKNPIFSLFDYGSLLDYLYGLNTRAYMEMDPPQRDYILNNI
jgi:hypothetical protein